MIVLPVKVLRDLMFSDIFDGTTRLLLRPSCTSTASLDTRTKSLFLKRPPEYDGEIAAKGEEERVSSVSAKGVIEEDASIDSWELLNILLMM